MTRIIARYKTWKVWGRLTLMAAILAAIPALTIWYFHRAPQSAGPHFYERHQLLMTWILSVPAALTLFSILRQLVFHQGRLIWIEDGLLIWRDKGFFAASCRDIVRVTAGTGGKFDQLDAITLKMRDGSEKTIETDALSEPCDDVVLRLRSALGLENPVPETDFRAWHSR